jgi:hypothetical protein
LYVGIKVRPLSRRRRAISGSSKQERLRVNVGDGRGGGSTLAFGWSA